MLRPEHKEIMKSRRRNLKITLAYDGTNYHGFQRQNRVLAVQNVLEDVFTKLCGDTIELAAAGRTDAGVHAKMQVVNFFTNGTIPTENIVRAGNRLLPQDIVLLDAQEVDRDFSALHSTRSKVYEYRIYYSPVRNPFRDRYALFVDKPLNYQAMAEALRYIIGEHDFTSFKSSGGNDTSPIREIYEATCTQHSDEYVFSFFGSGFLYHMVRNLMGLILNIGLGKYEPAYILDVLKAKDRSCAGKMAPAHGLYLSQVNYE